MGWKPFPYTPLSGTQIRYINIHPSNGTSGKVQCTLHQAPLEDVGFDALSYAWGDTTVTETIILSGKPFRATTNLVACLRQLATRSGEKGLWVDAICINQNDVYERNLQVQRMKEIYRAARSVIAWLGSSTRLSRIGVRRLKEIDLAETAKLLEHGIGHKNKQKSRILKGIVDGAGEQGLRDLLDRPYWCRTWIIQEFSLGHTGETDTRVRLLCGEDEIPFYNLWALTGLLTHSYNIDLYIRGGGQGEDTGEPSRVEWRRLLAQFFHIPQVSAFRVIKTAEEPIRPLLELLAMFRQFECSDNRDKIYALLGISNDAEGIVPDYNKSTAAVYGDVVHWLIKKHDSLDVLSMAFYHSEKDLSHASWIPDWRCGAPDAYSLADNTRENGAYGASKGLSVSSHAWSLDSAAGRLHLAGACLDTITSINKAVASNYTVGEILGGLITRWTKMVHEIHGKGAFETTMELGLDGGCYPLNDNEPLAEACRRTLVGDYDKFGRGPARSPFMMLFPWDQSQRRSDGSLYTFESTVESYSSLWEHRGLAITSKGWIGLVRKEAEVGDHVAVLVGASVPFILRKAQRGMAGSRDNEYTLIGDGYIHGLMHGRGLDLAEMGEIVLR